MDTDKIDGQMALPPMTAPDKISMCMRGFSDIPSAEMFAEDLWGAVREVSRLINLERLDGITVAYDYNDALSQLDRGYSATRPLSPTSDEKILGVAMTPPVFRSGQVKAHIVFSAIWVLPLQDKEQTFESRRAVQLIAHECAHVENLKHLDEAFPGTILQRQYNKDEEEAKILDSVVAPLWDEYAACRASCLFGPDQTTIFGDSVLFSLEDARSSCNDAISRYRLHGDVNRVLDEAGTPLFQPLRMLAYLLGHLDGLGLDLDEVPTVRDRVGSSAYARFLPPLWQALRTLWVDRGRWANRSAFDSLKTIARDLYAEGGMILEGRSDGILYVNIPITPSTVPY